MVLYSVRFISNGLERAYFVVEVIDIHSDLYRVLTRHEDHEAAMEMRDALEFSRDSVKH